MKSLNSKIGGSRLAATLIVLWSVMPAFAQFYGAPNTEVPLTKGKIPSGVTWSAAFKLTSDGLQQLPDKAADIWIQTDKIPVGMRWRPPASVTVSLSICGEGVKDSPDYAYVRFGCDGVHWSTWYPMRPSEKLAPNCLATYTCDLGLPSVAMEKCYDLEKEWKETNPDWKDDTDAFCRWIAKNHAGFFEHEIPLLGYVQLRVESFSGLSRKWMKFVIGREWSVSGLYHSPKDPKQADSKKEWCFELTREDKTARNKSSKLAP
jgi:hypothetical protein